MYKLGLISPTICHTSYNIAGSFGVYVRGQSSFITKGKFPFFLVSLALVVWTLNFSGSFHMEFDVILVNLGDYEAIIWWGSLFLRAGVPLFLSKLKSNFTGSKWV